MNDVSKTNEDLLAEAGGHQVADQTDPDGDYCRSCADAWPCVTRRLADALEAQTGVRVDMSSAVGVETQLATTEELRPAEMTAKEAIELVLKRPGMYGLVPKNEHRSMKAERDAALAAIERVRAVHARDSVVTTACSECSDFGTDENPVWLSVPWPCATIQALDGAPEPDREAQLERVAARLREIVYLCGDDLGCQCEEAQDASADLARELSIIAAERPTLTTDEVWAIAKAEHDWANDSDNVGAFVDSLTDALRTAGVAFDEQPFIDSGYLLPVGGESK